ncbi:hypothetical protein HX13_01520 [Chryseobacterium sp. P1-3]|uniref:hypothetical protein n=1 Tax=Chryseobacterium sp. (strain P1-3) TaxID=1517683 RepID=UPI0004E70A1D|nr:hypothetical protein [Chryseobacterium sp. P1-3]KFF76048.1 hypothetical protein HX13_01520 [Chryseobacterium sp. P1-3]
MKNNNLPTDQLKKYGIIDQDNTFSKKLSPEDIQRFLQGYTIVADNDKRRATFQLVENNSRLNVIFLERDKNLSELLENSEKRIEYTDIKEVSNKLPSGFLGLEKKAFVFDEETGKVFEFDLTKHATELTAIIADKKDAEELGRYKNELLKLKAFINNKLEAGFPHEIAKEISRDLNIVSREIDIVDEIFQKQEKSDVQLNVNDPDLYQDGIRMREEEQQERDEKRGFRR